MTVPNGETRLPAPVTLPAIKLAAMDIEREAGEAAARVAA